MTDQNITIEYIGKRDPWKDSLYQSGLTFAPKQSRHVPEPIARKLLRHADLFKQVDKSADTKSEPKADSKSDAKTEDKADDTQAQLAKGEKAKADKQKQVDKSADILDQVNVMEKDSLEKFAKEHFDQDLDKRLSVDKLREQVRGYIDQFGIV